MKITRADKAPATQVIRFDVEDGPVHAQASRAAGRTFQVERVAIMYTYSPATGAWVVRSAYDIEVSGRVVLKTGGLSPSYHSRQPGGETSAVFTPGFGWDWLAGLINRYRPTGRVENRD